jgi:uncharacterized membrane protein YccC
MSLVSLASGALRRLSISDQHRRHGLQLGAAVVLAYFASAAAGLPEQFWAVMSTLIVMRPNTGGTLDAGWDRVSGTMVGVLCGLLGVYFQHLGANMLITTLSIVAALAFASAGAPRLRSAAVAALIILAAGKLAGYTALQAALVRVIQIAIGVGVAMAMALMSSRYRAAARLNAGCASLLRRMANRLQQASEGAWPTEAESEGADKAARGALSRLAVLAGNADREARLFRRSGPAIDARHHRSIARLTSRIFQDTALLHRVLRTVSQRQDDGLWNEAAKIASAALACAADAIGGDVRCELDDLRRLAESRDWNASDASTARESAVLLAAPMRLLLEDLQQLFLCAGRGAISDRR